MKYIASKTLQRWMQKIELTEKAFFSDHRLVHSDRAPIRS